MSPSHVRAFVVCASLVLFGFALAASAQEPELEPKPEADVTRLPTIKFFYYDAGGIEWAVSAEPERLERHLAAHPESQELYQAVSAAVLERPDTSDSARQMTRWLDSERERFDQTRNEAPRLRMAEGVVAYLRAHDFSIEKLVEAIKRRAGTAEVELVVVHLRDRQGNSSFKLKIVPIDAGVALDRQGFNVNLPAPKASYTIVAYALAVALYEVEEIINRDSSQEGAPQNDSIEPPPLPEPIARPAPVAVPAG